MKNIKFKVNGIERQVSASPELVLLDYLREDLRLTGTKQSCDRKGQCGACMVIINGKAVTSCLKKVADLEGASIITVEGLGTPENPHLIQEAYTLSGAIQCGFCTPGMIMATKVLLDKNPDPDVPAIKNALARNKCRCTGYTKIIDAVILAGRFLRRETTPEEIRAGLKKGITGVSHERPSSILKACGTAEFTGDIKLPGMIELALVHSTEHHAIIKSIDAEAAKKMPGVIGIMTPEDIKGTNRIRVSVPDQPVLCEDKVRILGDPIIAIAAETRSQARAAAATVKVEYEPLPVMLHPDEALAPEALQIHPHSPNTCFTQPLIKGEPEKALAGSVHVVEADFSTQMNHQFPLETEACVSYFESEGENATLIVVGRSINIHLHASHIKEAIGWENLHYREAFSGGQFGIKSNVTSEAVTAAAVLHFKRPVRYIPSLEESMLTTTKRHPYQMTVRLASDAQGHLTAYENIFTVNKGAYSMLGPVPLMRSLHMLSGSYYIPHINSLGKLVYTNNGYGGAARGAGPPQTIFALESAVDMLADKLEIDPLKFRLMNSLKPGQTKATGMVAEQWPFPELCDAIKPYYEKAKSEAAAFNKDSATIKRGVGIAAASFGIGVSGDKAKIAVEVDTDDFVTVYAAVADPGEGNESMLMQLAAEELEIPLDKVRIYTRNTDKTFPSGPSAGSRQTWMNGGALVNALKQLKQAMDEAGSITYEGLQKAGKSVRFEGNRLVPGSYAGYKLDPETGQGDSFVSECHNIQMAELEVNTETGDVKVNKVTCVVDAGTVINPQNLEGQVEGGMDQGVGYALREEFIIGKTKDYTSFNFPSMKTAFNSEIIIRETPRIDGPQGATGVGEMTMVSTAPAVTNAIRDACGVRIYDLPATPGKIKAALESKA